MNKKATIVEKLVLWVAGILVPGLLWAGMANVPTQWSNGLENWSASSDKMAMRVTNENGAVVLMYAASATYPGSEEGKFVADETASYGMYAGDILNIGATAVTFRVTGVGAVLSQLAATIETTDGHVWTFLLTPPQPNQSKVYQIPLIHGQGWWNEDGYAGTEAEFADAFSRVKLFGIRIIRGGSTLAHGCVLDDFKLIGPTISGAGLYTGEQSGNLLKVRAEAVSAPVLNQSVPRTYAVSATAPVGTFRITDAAAPQTYRLKAFLDINGNDVLDFWEPRGEWGGGEFILTAPMESADIVLSDPTTDDNVPYWWLVKNCGATSEEQIRSRTGDDWIRDWAGSNFTVRIVNLGNGQVALRWKHIPGRQFQIEGGETPEKSGLVDRGSPVRSLNSTGNEENEVTPSIIGSSAQFYRVKLVTP
jgi:hypothetical protein